MIAPVPCGLFSTHPICIFVCERCLHPFAAHQPPIGPVGPMPTRPKIVKTIRVHVSETVAIVWMRTTQDGATVQTDRLTEYHTAPPDETWKARSPAETWGKKTDDQTRRADG